MDPRLVAVAHGTDVAEPIPETGASGLPAQMIAALAALATGSMLLVIGRRRPTI